MKLFWLLLSMLFVLACALAALSIIPRSRAPADCGSRVVIAKGLHGEPVECVCLEGQISTCFNPGP